MFVKRLFVKRLLRHFFSNPINILFYVKNLIFRYNDTPKELRLFQCFLCKENFVFPLTSKDFVACNSCFKEIAYE